VNKKENRRPCKKMLVNGERPDVESMVVGRATRRSVPRQKPALSSEMDWVR
jgi:hypothetical protein